MTPLSSLRDRAVCGGLAALAALLSVELALAKFFTGVYYLPFSPWRLVEGTAERPHQYRVLFPWLARLLGVDSPQLFFITADALAAFGLWVGVFAYLLRRMTFPRSALGSYLLFPILSCLFLRQPWHPWDLPGAAFLVLHLHLLASPKPRSWLLLFGLASCNRETTIFWIPARALLARRGAAFAAAAAPLGVWILLRLFFSLLYAGNPGPAETHFYSPFMRDNLERFSTLRGLGGFLLQFLINGGGFLLPAYLLAPRSPDPVLRASAWTLYAHCLAIFTISTPREPRVFAEMAPLALLIVVVALERRVRRRA